MSGRWSIFASLALGLAIACGGRQADELPPASAAPAPDRPSIILISIDTLRSDRLPVYGYAGGETPAIDSLRRDSILFERAYSHTPLTLPSHASILTGQLPGEHGVRDNQGYELDSASTTYLPRELKRLGYATGAAVSAYVLRGDSGLARDFDLYEDQIELRGGVALGGVARPGTVTLEAIEPWLRRVAKPFFLLFHLFEPHMPYDPPDPRWSDPYDGEVAAADAVVGGLLDLLRELGIYQSSVIVLLSDHGEGLGDHGELEHGIFLYREALQVPLMLKLPSARQAGQSVRQPAQLIDVYPTLIDLAGGTRPADLPGMSLLEIEGTPTRRIYSETFYPRLHYGWSDLASVIEGELHWIDGPDPELYDLADDPAERRNVLRQNRRVAADLRAHLESHDRSLEPPSAVDPETREKLAALGYMGATAAETGPLPDPKAQLPTLEDLRRAAEHLARGEPEAAVPLYRRALAANPGMLDGWQTLGDVLLRLGRLEEAALATSRAFEISGGDPELGRRAAAVWERLAGWHLERRSWAEAREASRNAVDLDPTRTGAWNDLGVARYYLGDRAQALDAWQRAVDLDPGNLDTLYNLGTRAAELGRRDQARRALESYLEQAPPRYREELRQARLLLRRLEG